MQIIFWLFCSWLISRWWWLTAADKKLNKFPPSGHFWHTRDIWRGGIFAGGQISMYIHSIKCASIDGRPINNYSERFPMIDEWRAKNALFLFLMPSLPGNQTWEILWPSLHWHGRHFHDDAIPILILELLPGLTQMVFWEGDEGRLAGKMGRFLWSMPGWWKKRSKRCFMWRLLDPLQDCGGLHFSGGFAVRRPLQEVQI